MVDILAMLESRLPTVPQQHLVARFVVHLVHHPMQLPVEGGISPILFLRVSTKPPVPLDVNLPREVWMIHPFDHTLMVVFQGGVVVPRVLFRTNIIINDDHERTRQEEEVVVVVVTLD